MLRKLKLMLMPIAFNCYKVIYWLFNLLPVQKNKVVATTMRGRKFSDSPRFIIERLHELNPDLDIVWFVDDRYQYSIPSWVRIVPYYRFGMLRRIYEMATAKVWINSHMWEVFVLKKKDQLFIQTYHASISLKKIYLDINGVKREGMAYQELIRTSRMIDVFISNSLFNDSLIRRAFDYRGDIYRCGFPRNDELISPTEDYRTVVRKELCLEGKKIFLYAPTFRDEFEKTHHIDYSVYGIDFEGVYQALTDTFGGDWVILVKFHPIMQNFIEEKKYFKQNFVKNVTSYVNMQDLLAAADFVLTDYSSSVIDSAMAGIPGFTIGLDYDRYMEDRDLYFKLNELPFPFARTNEELVNNIRNFNIKDYEKRWNEFKKEIGLNETGCAGKYIACQIEKFLNGEKIEWVYNKNGILCK